MLQSGRDRIPQKQLEQQIGQTRQCHPDTLDTSLDTYGLGTKHPDVHLLKGNPATTIHSLSGEFDTDVIVMGTVGRMGIPGFIIGNTAEEVLQNTKASVLAVKPTDFVSPVALA